MSFHFVKSPLQPDESEKFRASHRERLINLRFLMVSGARGVVVAIKPTALKIAISFVCFPLLMNRSRGGIGSRKVTHCTKKLFQDIASRQRYISLILRAGTRNVQLQFLEIID